MSQPRPLYYYVLAEIFGVVFTMVPAIAAWGVGLVFAYHCFADGCVWLAVLSPFVVCFSLFLIQYFLFLLLPKLKPGLYRIGPNPMMLSWLAQLNLARALGVSGFRNLVFSSGLLRFFYFRSLGCKYSYRATVSLNVRPVDYALISIGPDSTIGDQTELSCHTMTSKHLVLGAVSVGARVFVSAHCVLGYNCDLKDGSYVGYGNIIAKMTVESGKKIKDFEFPYGPAKAPSED